MFVFLASFVSFLICFVVFSIIVMLSFYLFLLFSLRDVKFVVQSCGFLTSPDTTLIFFIIWILWICSLYRIKHEMFLILQSVTEMMMQL